MTFGEKIRESRISLKLTQKQLADRIGAKHNSVSDWENDKNKPDPNTIELLCGVLNISPNYLLNSNSDDFSLYEKEIIKKYRALDPHGKEMVDFTLQKEWERSTQPAEGQLSIIPVDGYQKIWRNGKWENYQKWDEAFPELNAAHARTVVPITDEDVQNDNDIMDDESF